MSSGVFGILNSASGKSEQGGVEQHGRDTVYTVDKKASYPVIGFGLTFLEPLSIVLQGLSPC